MSKKLDVMHEWLGISPADQPPNHYRLLGIEKFESNQEVIEAAVARLKLILQENALKNHADAAKELYREIKLAKTILLNKERKAIYDRLLVKGPRKKFVAPSRSAKSHPLKNTEVSPVPEFDTAAKSGNRTQTSHDPQHEDAPYSVRQPILTPRVVLACVALMVLATIAGSIGIVRYGHQPEHVASVNKPGSNLASGELEVADYRKADSNVVESNVVDSNVVDSNANVPASTDNSQRAELPKPPQPRDDVEVNSNPDWGELPDAHAHWEAMLGLQGRLIGQVQSSRPSQSGKTRYLFFSSDTDDAMVYMHKRRVGDQLRLEFLKSLEGKRIRVTGKVEREFGTRRIGILIQKENQIEVLN